ncbi:hypothetical protein bwei_5312 [Bacillus mycoides]|nr:hypothetical protein bwei_5312 [Bacillus mycoides]
MKLNFYNVYIGSHPFKKEVIYHTNSCCENTKEYWKSFV